jgi:hypothetical protein
VTTDLWVTATSMPTARKALAAAATTTRLFAVGGDSPGPPYVVHGTLEMLTFATDAWLTRKRLRTARHALRPLARYPSPAHTHAPRSGLVALLSGCGLTAGTRGLWQ